MKDNLVLGSNEKKILEVIQQAVKGNYNNHHVNLGNKEDVDDLALALSVILEEFKTQPAEKFWQKKRTFYVAVLEHLPVGIAVLDKHLRYIYCNPAYFGDEELRSKALGQTDYDLFLMHNITHTQAYARLSLFKKARENRSEVSQEEVVIRENAKRNVLRTVYPLLNQINLEKELFLCCLTDITATHTQHDELVQKNSQLEKINHELNKFIHHVTHDLKAPLASLAGLIDLSSHLDSEHLALNLEMMKKNVRKMDAFIKAVLDHLRNASTNTAFSIIKFDEEVENIIQLLQHMDNAQKIHFNIDVKNDIDFYTDPIRVHMILNNLISNAIKYHNYEQEAPFIHIIVNADERMAKITVVDNGEGIAPEHHSEIFKSFIRKSEKSKGSGLGLFLVKEAVQKLRGKISFESAPGKGSSFEVIIPNEKVFSLEKA